MKGEALKVTVDEGHALEVLDLLCRGRAIRIVPAQPIEAPRPELAEVAARRLAAVCLRLLAETGSREQVVLRRGRRVRGRIWDAAMNEGFRLRFTAATYELWVQATQRLAEIARATEVVEGLGSSKRARRQIRKIVKVADTDTGDWLLYALAVRHLARVAMPVEIREDLGRRLCLGSPLATLFALDGRPHEGPGLLAEQLDSLVGGPGVRLLECLGELLAEQWAEQVGACMRWLPAPQRTARIEAAADVLGGYVDCLDRHERLDLCAPLCRALALLLADAWAGEPSAVVQRLVGDAGLTTHAQRDALRRSLARIAGLGARLWGHREALAREGYGDPRYEESQLVLAVCDAALRPHLRRLDVLASALTGRIG